jgi:hypothetical protein
MPKLSDQMPLVQVFHARSASIHSSMVKRFSGKVAKNGRVIRQHRIVPFTLAEFRLWLLEKLGGRQDGSARCEYCNGPVFADTLRIDHRIPASRGGELGFPNLAISCDRDNRMKGSLTAAEFVALQVVFGDMLRDGRLHPDGFKDIEKRLCGIAAVFRRFTPKKSKPEASGLLVDDPEQLRLLRSKVQ